MADAIACLRPSSKLEPALQSEVDALSAIEPHIETRMVASRIRDDELILPLYESVHADAIVGEFRG
jgi:hypothetical protein